MTDEAAVEEFVRATYDYWAGAFEVSVDQDAPDGAWFQMHVDTADWHLENWSAFDVPDADGKKIVPPRGIDGHDVTMVWLRIGAERKEESNAQESSGE